MVNPAGKTRPPFAQGEAAGGLASHDAAFAQRETQCVQCHIHRLRKGARGLALGRRGVVRENQRVVLVGGDGLFTAAFGAQGQPAQIAQVNLVLLRLEDQQAFGQHIVEVADQGRQLARLHALAEQVSGKAADLVGHQLQRGHVGAGPHAGTEGQQADALQREQVTFRQNARNAPLPRNRHMANAVAGHQQCGILRGVLRCQGSHRLDHHLRDRRLQRHLGQCHPVHHVMARQDAQNLAIGVHHEDRANLFQMDGLQRLAQGRVGCAADRLTADQRAQRCLQ